ncbi:hypothetical protein ACUY3S_02290 [Corynebacterium resistens]
MHTASGAVTAALGHGFHVALLSFWADATGAEIKLPTTAVVIAMAHTDRFPDNFKPLNTLTTTGE